MWEDCRRSNENSHRASPRRFQSGEGVSTPAAPSQTGSLAGDGGRNGMFRAEVVRKDRAGQARTSSGRV